MSHKNIIDSEKSWQVLIYVLVGLVFVCLLVNHVTAFIFMKQFTENDARVSNNTDESGYTVNITALHGTVAVAPVQDVYKKGTQLTITPLAHSGFIFDTWSGDWTGRENPLIIQVTDNITLIAHFMEQISASGRQTGSVSSQEPLTHEKSKQLFAGI